MIKWLTFVYTTFLKSVCDQIYSQPKCYWQLLEKVAFWMALNLTTHTFGKSCKIKSEPFYNFKWGIKIQVLHLTESLPS